MRVAITGATGLVGGALVRRLVAAGDEVLALSRDPDRARADLPDGVDAARFAVGEPDVLAPALAGADAVVNLAGEPILGRRWNDQVKEEIRRSRVEGTRTVVRAIAEAPDGPKTLVNASAVGFYGPLGAEPVNEDAPAGDDFLARVCVDWEVAAREAESAGVRVAIVRVGVVLSRDGGALPRMLPPFRWFVGGRVGNGRQGFPWVHVDDIVGILEHAVRRDGVSGPLNGTAPDPVTNREFAKALGRALRRPAWLPVPGFALRIALGPVARTLLSGQLARPERTRALGYEFRFPELEGALAELIKRS